MGVSGNQEAYLCGLFADSCARTSDQSDLPCQIRDVLDIEFGLGRETFAKQWAKHHRQLEEVDEQARMKIREI